MNLSHPQITSLLPEQNIIHEKQIEEFLLYPEDQNMENFDLNIESLKNYEFCT